MKQKKNVMYPKKKNKLKNCFGICTKTPVSYHHTQKLSNYCGAPYMFESVDTSSLTKSRLDVGPLLWKDINIFFSFCAVY